MAIFLNNKFNVINTLDKDHNFNYKSQIIKFVENYVETEISILHPDYLYQITINNTYEKEEINNELLVIFKNYLKKIKVNVKNNIKNDNFSIDNGLNKLINNYIYKINYLNEILKINKNELYNLVHNIIISDQIIITFIESELSTLIIDTNSEIKQLLTNIKIINKENHKNYIWFLKLFGTIFKNNIPEIKENISNKLLYEIKLLTNYIINVKNKYSFIGIDTEFIIEPITDIYIEKIKIFLNCENNFDDFYFLINYFWKDISDILFFNNNYINTIKNYIAIKIQKKINNLNDNTEECFKFIKLIILLNDYKIAENQLFLLFNNEKIYNNIIKFISYNIINNFDITNKLILLLTSIKEKDVFIQNYHYELIKRLLSNKPSINLEKILKNTLIKVFGEKDINKINKCINDYVLSGDQIKMYGTSTFDTKLITTSYEAWNINYTNGFLDKFVEEINYKNGLLNFIDNYNNFYKTMINDRKKLLWLLQYGEVEVEYNNYTLKMLPIQLLILELFNTHNSLLIKDILSNKLLVNYNSDYLNKIILSLVISGLLINNNNNLTLSLTVNNTDLIMLYYNCTNINITEININITHSRKDIICTWINHLLKKGDKNFDALFTIISNEIKLFSLDKITLQKSIEYMIKQDYIKESNDYYTKIFY
jgi:hypothetical protein